METDLSNTIDQELLVYIVKNLVAYPDDVVVQRKVDEMGVLLTLSVNAEDMGMIIGREGAMARSLRTVVKAIGKKHRMMISLNIIEPLNGRLQPKPEKIESIGEAKNPDSVSISDDLAEFAIN
jgi:predicted RNA-binding protein YlqC (UPF0109 family)